MIKIPKALLQKYNQLLVNSDFALDQYVNCKKWLRYYLDFCKKYTHPYAKTKSLALFLEKLKEKKRSLHHPRTRLLMHCSSFSGMC
jgi:hypothetical protein